MFYDWFPCSHIFVKSTLGVFVRFVRICKISVRRTLVLLFTEEKLQFFCQEAIYIARRLKEKSSLWIAQFCKQPRSIDGIESLLHRKTTFVHQSGDKVFDYFLFHILKFRLRYFHLFVCFISLSMAL